jgi:long-chain fatty acid transport protein
LPEISRISELSGGFGLLGPPPEVGLGIRLDRLAITDILQGLKENYSIGAAVKPLQDWVVALDVQQISWHEVPALGNSGLNTLVNPQANPLGSKTGSGLNWRNQINYRLGVQYRATQRLTLRTGFAYGLQPRAENQGSTTLNLFTPNARANFTAGLSWVVMPHNDINFVCGRYFSGNFTAQSTVAAFPDIGDNARETVRLHVDTVWLGWSRHL